MGNEPEIIQEEEIASRIYFIRGRKVLLDADLAKLYEVPVKRLNEQVKRNLKRFPDDFMFSLTQEEWDSLRSQIATLKNQRGQHRKYLPNVFSEQGVGMLSSVLNSDRAIQVNIQIMRVFMQMRKLALSQSEIYRKLEEIDKKFLEQKITNHTNEQQFRVIFEAIKHILLPAEKPKQIGFITPEEKKLN